jgi:O-antigen/teichoic acid export membrane protein
MGMGFLKSVLVAKYLGPTLLGSYAFISLIIEYLSYYNLGVYGSMNREVSINYGDASKEKYIQKVFNTSLSFSLTLLAPIIFISLSFLWFAPNVFPETIRDYILIIVALVLFLQFRYFFLRYFRLYERYYIIITIELISNLIILFGTLLFVPKYSLMGLMVTLLVSNVLIFIISIIFLDSKLKFTLDRKLIKKLVIAGIPILFYTLGEKIFTSIDRLMIVNYFSFNELGQYQLGKTMAYGVLMSLDALLFIFYPKILKYLNSDTKGNRKDINAKDLITVSKYFDIVTLPIIIIGIILLPPFITMVLPNYLTSIYITKILLLGYGFQNLTFMPSSYLVSNNQQKKLAPIIGISVLLMIMSNYFVIKLGYGINGMVVATSMVFLMNTCLMFIMCFRHLEMKITKNTFSVIWRRTLFFFIALGIILNNYDVSYLIIPYLIIYSSITIKSIKKLMPQLL